MFVEAFEHMLEAWVSILHENQSFPAGFCQQSAIEIFNTYVQVSFTSYNFNPICTLNREIAFRQVTISIGALVEGQTQSHPSLEALALSAKFNGIVHLQLVPKTFWD